MSDGSSVTLSSGLSFAPGTSGVPRVSRRERRRSFPDRTRPGAGRDSSRIRGSPKQLVAPPDANFDHANFYWRMELQPERRGDGTLRDDGRERRRCRWRTNRYRGMMARITRGRGAGQERAIAANTATGVTVSPAWDRGAGCDELLRGGGERLAFRGAGEEQPGAVRDSEPVGRDGAGHAAGRRTSNDVECAAEISTVTRWQIGGSGTSGGDGDVPPEPLLRIGRRVRAADGGTERQYRSRPDEYAHDFVGHADAALLGRVTGACRAIALARRIAADGCVLNLSAAGPARLEASCRSRLR